MTMKFLWQQSFDFLYEKKRGHLLGATNIMKCIHIYHILILLSRPKKTNKNFERYISKRSIYESSNNIFTIYQKNSEKFPHF